MQPIISDTLNNEEISDLLTLFPFSKNQIGEYFDRFRFIDRTESGVISYSDLLLLPEFVANPLKHLIMETIEEIYGSSFTFLVFLQIMNLFSNKSLREERKRFFFMLINRNKTGRITKSVILKFYKEIRGEDFKKRIVLKSITKLFNQYDREKKGYLSREDIYFYYERENVDEIIFLK